MTASGHERTIVLDRFAPLVDIGLLPLGAHAHIAKRTSVGDPPRVLDVFLYPAFLVTGSSKAALRQEASAEFTHSPEA